MVIVKLKGGLGNQMFQYAAAKKLAKKSKVLFDTTFLILNHTDNEYFTARKFSLNAFKNIKVVFATGVLKYIIAKTILPESVRITQSDNNEIIDFGSIKFSHAYLEGYFQNENYFKEIKNQLLSDFEFPDMDDSGKHMFQKITDDENSVAVHVRRGDYLKPFVHVFHGTLPFHYYEQAADEIIKKINQPHFYIFSDDPAWCMQNFCSFRFNYTIVSNNGNQDWEDMKMMSACRHNIIANSSYSWWAAWLNKNPDKTVIAPKNWFVNNPSTIVPSEWIKL